MVYRPFPLRKGKILIMSDKLKRVVIKEELIALTGDTTKAIIMNQMVFWAGIIEDMDKSVKEEITAYRKLGNEDMVKKAEKKLRGGWFYKTADEMNEEIMISTRATVDRKMKELVKAGYFSTRKNPNNKWDKKNQYRVNIQFIREELAKLGYTLDGYKMLKSSNAQNEQSENTETREENSHEPLILSNAQNEHSIAQNEHSDAYNEHSYTVSNYSLSNFSLKKEEEEEGKAPSIQLEESVKEYLKTQLKYDSTLLVAIAEQMAAFGITDFTETEMADQHNFMIKQNEIKRIGDWAFYFVNGIAIRRTQPKNKVAAANKKKRTGSTKKATRTEMLPNWFNSDNDKSEQPEKKKTTTVSEEQKKAIWEQVKKLNTSS